MLQFQDSKSIDGFLISKAEIKQWSSFGPAGDEERSPEAVSLSVCRPILQVHAQHHRRTLGVGGGLPVRPRGDAAGRQGEPAALSRGLRA